MVWNWKIWIESSIRSGDHRDYHDDQSQHVSDEDTGDHQIMMIIFSSSIVTATPTEEWGRLKDKKMLSKERALVIVCSLASTRTPARTRWSPGGEHHGDVKENHYGEEDDHKDEDDVENVLLQETASTRTKGWDKTQRVSQYYHQLRRELSKLFVLRHNILHLVLDPSNNLSILCLTKITD